MILEGGGGNRYEIDRKKGSPPIVMAEEASIKSQKK